MRSKRLSAVIAAVLFIPCFAVFSARWDWNPEQKTPSEPSADEQTGTLDSQSEEKKEKEEDKKKKDKEKKDKAPLPVPKKSKEKEGDERDNKFNESPYAIQDDKDIAEAAKVPPPVFGGGGGGGGGGGSKEEIDGDIYVQNSLGAIVNLTKFWEALNAWHGIDQAIDRRNMSGDNSLDPETKKFLTSACCMARTYGCAEAASRNVKHERGKEGDKDNFTHESNNPEKEGVHISKRDHNNSVADAVEDAGWTKVEDIDLQGGNYKDPDIEGTDIILIDGKPGHIYLVSPQCETSSDLIPSVSFREVANMIPGGHRGRVFRWTGGSSSPAIDNQRAFGLDETERVCDILNKPGPLTPQDNAELKQLLLYARGVFPFPVPGA